MFHLFQKPKAQIRQQVQIPVHIGTGLFTTFHNLSDGVEHLAISFVDPTNPRPQAEAPLVRMHSECLTGDVFWSAKCDCGDQLQEAMKLLREQQGILLYLRQEGRGIGLYNKLYAYQLQAQVLDTYEANQKLGFGLDLRNYQVAAEMLQAMGVGEIKLLSNNPDKRAQLESFGIKVQSSVETGVFLKSENARYLEAKVTRTSHRIRLQPFASGLA